MADVVSPVLKAIVVMTGMLVLAPAGFAQAPAVPSTRIAIPSPEHSLFVGPAAFSPDGRTMLSANDSNALKIWDAASWQLLRSLSGHSDEIRCVAFSPDGRTVLSGSVDKTVKLWDAATGAPLRTFDGHSATVDAVAFSPDGRPILSGSDDKTLKLWDVASGRLLGTFKGQ